MAAMRLLRLISAYIATPWALRVETLHALEAVLRRAAVRGSLDKVEIDAAAPEAAKQDRNSAISQGQKQNVAVIPVYGVISHRAHMVQDICGPGGTSTEMLEKAINVAVADPTVRSIVLDIDSPGGSVSGVMELADVIVKARAQKPIAAVANSLAASAAYWIGTAAHELYVIPSGEVGSVGVYAAHEDWSKNLEEEGVKVTLISAGQFKVEGNPYEPLSADAQAYMQARVDEYYTQFVKGVAKQRGVSVDKVRNDFGQGRSVGANDALARGMVDGIATLGEVIQKYAKRTTETANKSRSLANAQIAIAAA